MNIGETAFIKINTDNSGEQFIYVNHSFDTVISDDVREVKIIGFGSNDRFMVITVGSNKGIRGFSKLTQTDLTAYQIESVYLGFPAIMVCRNALSKISLARKTFSCQWCYGE